MLACTADLALAMSLTTCLAEQVCGGVDSQLHTDHADAHRLINCCMTFSMHSPAVCLQCVQLLHGMLYVAVITTIQLALQAGFFAGNA